MRIVDKPEPRVEKVTTEGRTRVIDVIGVDGLISTCESMYDALRDKRKNPGSYLSGRWKS